MTNLITCLAFSIQLTTNWHNGGNIDVDGKLKSVRVGIIETNHYAEFIYDGRVEKVMFKRAVNPLPVVKLEEPIRVNFHYENFGVVTNYMISSNATFY